MKEFTLTKQVSKLGDNSIIVIPKFLAKEIQPKDVVEVRIRLLRLSTEVSS